MKTIGNSTELDIAIAMLQSKQLEDSAMLKAQFKITSESLNPISFIRNSFKELVEDPEFKDDLLNTSISLAAGFFSKKLAIGTTRNPFKLVLGNLIQILVARVVSKNSDDLRSKIMEVVEIVFHKKEPK